MINYFPEIYPDELLYSLLARYYNKSGYSVYISAAEELYSNKKVRPDIEFVNCFNDNALNIITKNKSMERIIIEHTMFPFYGRFIYKDKRQRAFHALVNMEGNYHNLLPIPKSKTERYIRYCPICADDDRNMYGETYWHRLHQMIGINICPVHSCELINSNVIISGKASPSLITAEETIDKNIVVNLNRADIEIELAKYIAEIFLSEIDMNSNVAVGDYLHHRMEGTKYLSARGKQRNISILHKDFVEFYKKIENNNFTELWQIQKVMTNDKINMVEICMLAMFLKISPYDLTHMSLPEKTQYQDFDSLIYELHKQGLNYMEIAKQMNSSYSVVKSVGEKLYGTYHKPYKKPLKSGAKARDWEQIDNDTLPLVIKAIKELYGNNDIRPKRVTVFAIEKKIGLLSKQIDNLPKCKAEIKKHYESQEQYWAREVVWAANKIISQGEIFNWKHIRNLTNMRKINLISCMPYIPLYANPKFSNKIQSLM